MFYYRGDGEIPKVFDPEDTNWVEIWNDVFMSYNLKEDGTLEELPKKNIDTGMGVERVIASLEGYDDNYMSSLWENSRKKLEELSNEKSQYLYSIFIGCRCIHVIMFEKNGNVPFHST